MNSRESQIMNVSLLPRMIINAFEISVTKLGMLFPPELMRARRAVHRSTNIAILEIAHRATNSCTSPNILVFIMVNFIMVRVINRYVQISHLIYSVHMVLESWSMSFRARISSYSQVSMNHFMDQSFY